MSRIYFASLPSTFAKAKIYFAPELKLFQYRRKVMSKNLLALPCSSFLHTVSKLEMASSLKGDSSSPTSVALTDLMESKSSSNLTIERRTNTFCNLYRSLESVEKSTVLCQLAYLWSSKPDITFQSVKKYITAKDKGDTALIKAEDNLRSTLAADRGWLLSTIARQEGGLKFLIDIRTDILDQINYLTVKGEVGASSEALKSLSNAIRDLIAPCFGVDLLKLERVTWSSPGNILQSVSEGEAVHPIRSWSDLKKRLGPQRRCFILSHQSLPLKPLAILHVALTKDISSSIHSIINRSPSESNKDPAKEIDDEQLATTAIFYSISSTQKGLAGIDLGQCLIKRSVRYLQTEITNLNQFSTLSPIPGFRSWLLHQLTDAERGRDTLLNQCNWCEVKGHFNLKETEGPPFAQLRQLLSDNSWVKEESAVRSLENFLMKLCAHYLYVEKRRSYALDTVANFHLRNGAVMWRTNWMADLSPRGLKNSFGIMVNYRYFLEECEDNSQAYVEKQQIRCTEQIQNLSCFAAVPANLSRL